MSTLTRLSSLGNDLHSGKVSVPIVRRRRTWYAISLIALVLLGGIAALRGVNLGIEFTGGSEFQIAGAASGDESLARDVVRAHVPQNEPKITAIGGTALRVQTAELDSAQTQQVAAELADAYGVQPQDVSSSFIGPVWGGDVTGKMVRGVAVFIVLVAIVMALYFRNATVSLAAMLTLVHDMLLTAAVYGVVGFEVTPATVIGFLTILGYSLYDTIVVFDKVRENTEDLGSQTRFTYAEAVELGANQTLMRSLNTAIVALLPVGSILAIGALLLGAGTLKDISLALFIGILVGTYSSAFIAPGLLVTLRGRERAIREHTDRVHAARAAGAPAGTDPSQPPIDADPEAGARADRSGIAHPEREAAAGGSSRASSHPSQTRR
ncbi:protein translocase subunit SecF [Brachybacterium sp. JHP9]|uniref:Protein-export membrane protein SecF n=1 Tax=Brachybacterium equifaecis TaxID=2910770 RepID=A0ABT0R2N4_9MICO|nr:protein translocase subunit SecF [Brachybacterium equifaecis]MCL6423499.1 protein translocase subunit SecF [Brachybacterium equifaecis]